MITIRLGVADREQLGAPEAMTYDPTRVRVADVRALKRETGLDIGQLAEGLQRRELEAVVAMVWLCLYRAGVTVSYDVLDFDIAEVEIEVDDPGKAPSSTGS